MTREEIQEVYAQGEAAVIGLIEELLQQLATQHQALRTFEARVEALENRQHEDSCNSSKLPASDRFGRRTRSLRGKSQRNSGRQKGHPGSTLEWIAEVDDIVLHRVNQCQGCRASLVESPVVEWDLRQVQDLPPIGLQVIEHQAEVKVCPVLSLLTYI